MIYMTYLHWIVVAICFILFLLLVLRSLKERRRSVFWSMVFASFVVMASIAVFALFLVDKYTKQAKLLSIENHRILRTEEIGFQGQVMNEGEFLIGKCILTVKMISNPIDAKHMNKGGMFKSGGSNNDSEEKKRHPNTIEKDFVIATELKPHEIRTFTVRMHYPSYFTRTRVIYKLDCR